MSWVSGWETDIGEGSIALFAGALAGGVLTGSTLAFAFVDWSAGVRLGSVAQLLALAFISTSFALLVWLFGLLLVGVPCWLILHHLGARHWSFAIALGTALTLPFGPLAPIGAVVGFIVWRVAYAPTTSPPALPQ